MIAIKSNKNLMFPPNHRGIVIMEIDLIQNKPSEEVYELRIIDKCIQEVEETYEETDPITGQTEEKTRTVIKQLGTEQIRPRKYHYNFLNQLSQELHLNIEDFSSYTEYINELFRQGLLIITKQECLNGKGMYFSEAQDWEIVRD